MTKAVEELLKAASLLSEEEQDELITALLQLHEPIKSDEELLTPELKAELDRRIAHMDAHPEEDIPLDEALRILRSKLPRKAGA